MTSVAILITRSVVDVVGSGRNNNYIAKAKTVTTADPRENVTSLPNNNSNNNSTNNSNNNNTSHKELTLIAEDASIEISPGERVKVWTFNGTMPGPTLRFTEGDNVTIHFINKTPMAHTLHLHGNHGANSDGVYPLILPNQNYTYNFIADPLGAFMYHCHASPTSLHIRMGMYGALIIDPKEPLLKPAREFSIVQSEFDPNNQSSFIPKYYPINGYANQYMDKNALQVKQNELVRFYLINIGTTIPYSFHLHSFHLHSTIFKAYQSGLISNTPYDAQTISIAPGDAAVVEAKWKYPGTYMFHSHGFEEERGNIGEIHVIPAASSGNSYNTNLTHSISMIPWQYKLQTKLEKPILTNDSVEQSTTGNSIISSHENNKTVVVAVGQQSHNATNNSMLNNTNEPAPIVTTVTILKGSWNNNQKENFQPKEFTAKSKSEVTWINNDNMSHTVTSDKAGIFDSSIISAHQQWKHTFNTIGSYAYHCTSHPWMEGKVAVVVAK
jgi:plastocyanin